MVALKHDRVIILGGRYNGGTALDSRIYTLDNMNFPKIKMGPDLTELKSDVACGLLLTEDTSEKMVVVAGG